MGWLAGWGQRIQLRIDKNSIDDTLTNFPILIYLSASSGINSQDVTAIFDELGANRLKIAVTTTDGETECYVEVEKWDNGNEEGWLWVKMPSISNIINTILYLYYDNTHANNTTYVGDPNSVPAETVWDGNFKFVTHMRDDPDTSHIRDSTENDNDGTKKGANEPQVTVNGKINGAQIFDGVDDYVDLGSDSSLDLGNNFTIEFWMKMSKRSSPNIIGRVNALWEPYWFIGTTWGAKTIDAQLWDTTGKWSSVESTVVVIDDTLHHIVWTRDGDIQKLYVDGVDRTSIYYLDAGIGDVNPAENVYIGGEVVGPCCFYEGLLDEVRILNVTKNLAWVKANYESQRDNLLTFGSIQSPDYIGNGLVWIDEINT